MHRYAGQGQNASGTALLLTNFVAIRQVVQRFVSMQVRPRRFPSPGEEQLIYRKRIRGAQSPRFHLFDNRVPGLAPLTGHVRSQISRFLTCANNPRKLQLKKSRDAARRQDLPLHDSSSIFRFALKDRRETGRDTQFQPNAPTRERRRSEIDDRNSRNIDVTAQTRQLRDTSARRKIKLMNELGH